MSTPQNPSDIPKEIEDQLALYFDNQATPQVVQAIQDWLEEDPANAEIFAEYGYIERMIFCAQKKEDASAIFGLLAELEDNAEAEVVTFVGELPQQRKDPGSLSAHDLIAVSGYVLRKALISKPAIYTGIGTVAAAVLLLTLILINPFASDTPSPIVRVPDDPSPWAVDPVVKAPIVATLTAEHDAQWAEQAFPRGSELLAGQRLTLTAGFAEVTTRHGAIAILEAPATIELLNNDNALRLHTGKLVGICQTPSSKGFAVKTGYANIVDIGTEFGVEVTDTGVQTTVFVGEVEIQTPTGTTQRLTHNQTARVVVIDGSRELAIEDRVAEGFVRSLPGLARSAITDDFDHATSFDPDAGQGWAGPWQTKVHSMMGLTLNTAARPPLASASGRHLQAVFTSRGVDAMGSFIRRFDRYEAVDRTKPHRISFLLRVDDSFVPSAPFDQRLSVFDSPIQQEGTSGLNTWMIGAFGFPQKKPVDPSDGIGELNVGTWSWSYYDGDLNATGDDPANLSKIKDTGVPLVPGQTYAIQISVDPEASVWDLLIISGEQRFDSREALGQPIRFRSNATQAGGHLHFAVRNAKTGSENRLQIDELQIEPMTFLRR
jgi:hypothetical protein